MAFSGEPNPLLHPVETPVAARMERMSAGSDWDGNKGTRSETRGGMELARVELRSRFHKQAMSSRCRRAVLTQIGHRCWVDLNRWMPHVRLDWSQITKPRLHLLLPLHNAYKCVFS